MKEIGGFLKATEEVSKNGDKLSGVLRLHFEGTPGHLTGVVCFTVHFPQCFNEILTTCCKCHYSQ